MRRNSGARQAIVRELVAHRKHLANIRQVGQRRSGAVQITRRRHFVSLCGVRRQVVRATVVTGDLVINKHTRFIF